MWAWQMCESELDGRLLGFLLFEEALEDAFLGSSAGGVVVGVVAAGLGWAFSRSTGALTRPLLLVSAGSFSGCWNLVKSSMDGRIVGELTR